MTISVSNIVSIRKTALLRCLAVLCILSIPLNLSAQIKFAEGAEITVSDSALFNIEGKQKIYDAKHDRLRDVKPAKRVKKIIETTAEEEQREAIKPEPLQILNPIPVENGNSISTEQATAASGVVQHNSFKLFAQNANFRIVCPDKTVITAATDVKSHSDISSVGTISRRGPPEEIV
jgi:hypothetical protein